MTPGTTEWLRVVAQLSEQAKAEVVRGGSPVDDVVKRYAHAAVERQNVDFRVACEDLGLAIPTLWSEKQSLRFACEVEAYLFSRDIIADSLEGLV